MTITSPPSTVSASALSQLYILRFAFAFAWALTVLAFASELNPFVSTLLVLYPLYDAVAIAADLRRNQGRDARTALLLNLVVSAVVAAGLVIATTSGIPAVLRVWGAWAIVAGITQLVVGLRRRAAGGQVPMIASGAISVLAGVAFAIMASADDPALDVVGGYALVGSLFFLGSAVLLRRRRA